MWPTKRFHSNHQILSQKRCKIVKSLNSNYWNYWRNTISKRNVWPFWVENRQYGTLERGPKRTETSVIIKPYSFSFKPIINYIWLFHEKLFIRQMKFKQMNFKALLNQICNVWYYSYVCIYHNDKRNYNICIIFFYNIEFDFSSYTAFTLC